MTKTKEPLLEELKALEAKDRNLREAQNRAQKRREGRSKTAFASNRAIGVDRKGKRVVEDVVEK